MQKKISAWILLLVLHMGMAWLLIAAVQNILSDSSNKENDDITLYVSGWDTADAAIDDVLIGYDTALKLRTKLSLAMGNEKVGDIYINKERLLREPEVLSVDSLLETADAINSFYWQYSVPTCMTALPEAAEIYKECLPENATVPSQLEQLDSFYERIDTKIRTINSHHVLTTFKEDYIYYRTDSRCTAYGAYCLYRNLIRKMGYYPVPYDSCIISHVKNDLRGDLYDSCLYDKVTPDILDVYTCENSSNIVSVRSFDGNSWQEGSFYDEQALEEGDVSAFYIGKPQLLTEIITDVENGKKLLVFKDSYGDSMLPFLTQHYAEIDAVDMSCLDRPLTDLLDPSDYQQVLILCDADTLTDTEAFSYIAEDAVFGGEEND